MSRDDELKAERAWWAAFYSRGPMPAPRLPGLPEPKLGSDLMPLAIERALALWRAETRLDDEAEGVRARCWSEETGGGVELTDRAGRTWRWRVYVVDRGVRLEAM